MSKSKGTVETPVNVIRSGQTARQGIAPGVPEGYRSTVNPNFAEPGIRTGPEGAGTPFSSTAGNPDSARTVRLQHPYGLVLSESGQDHNDARSNGDGTILDHMSRDYENPRSAPTLDSPVPREAPVFDTMQIPAEKRADLGKGRGNTAPNEAMGRDNLMAIGGVMSRGMDSTSQRGQPEDELTRDDTLRGNAGSLRDVQGSGRR